MHDIVEIVDSQTSIFIGLACNSTQEVVTFTARLVSTSSGKEVRYRFVSFMYFVWVGSNTYPYSRAERTQPDCRRGTNS